MVIVAKEEPGKTPWLRRKGCGRCEEAAFLQGECFALQRPPTGRVGPIRTHECYVTRMFREWTGRRFTSGRSRPRSCRQSKEEKTSATSTWSSPPRLPRSRRPASATRLAVKNRTASRTSTTSPTSARSQDHWVISRPLPAAFYKAMAVCFCFFCTHRES